MAGTMNPGGVAKSIVNVYSSGGQGYNATSGAYGEKTILSGALTAATYSAALVSVSGPGVLNLCWAYANDATSRTVGLKVVLDGTTIFDAVSNAAAAQYHGLFAVGCVEDANNRSYQPLEFNSSMALYVKSSLSETDKITLAYAYETR